MFYDFRQVVGYNDRYLVTDGFYVWDTKMQMWLSPNGSTYKSRDAGLKWQEQGRRMFFMLKRPDGSLEKRMAEGLWVEAMSANSERISLDLPIELPREITNGRKSTDGKVSHVLHLSGNIEAWEATEHDEKLRPPWMSAAQRGGMWDAAESDNH